MKGKRFALEPIVSILKQADRGMPVADIIRDRRQPGQSITPRRANQV